MDLGKILALLVVSKLVDVALEHYQRPLRCRFHLGAFISPRLWIGPMRFRHLIDAFHELDGPKGLTERLGFDFMRLPSYGTRWDLHSRRLDAHGLDELACATMSLVVREARFQDVEVREDVNCDSTLLPGWKKDLGESRFGYPCGNCLNVPQFTLLRDRSAGGVVRHSGLLMASNVP